MTMPALRPALALVVVGGLLLSGCSRGADEATPRPATNTASPSTQPVDLPPGDPGLDAPSVPDPGVPKVRHGDHDVARKVVPPEAMLGSQMVSQVLGGQWQEVAAPPLECTAELDEVASRTVAYESTSGRVLQTVATHESHGVADRTVRDMTRLLQLCGWTIHPDPRLGSASAAASSPEDAQAALVVAAEGVTVTLVGSDDAIKQMARWSSLADVALGNSCAASPAGCH